MQMYADLSVEIPDIMNECVIGPDGCVFVGSVGFNLLEGQGPKATRLVRVRPDGSISRVGPELEMPNGMVLSNDGQTLFVAESIGARIIALSIGRDGNVEFDRIVADLRMRDVNHPDGLAVGRDGSLFYAAPLVPGTVVQIDGAGDEVDRFSVELPHATSCAIGGSDGETLFVTSTNAMPGHDRATPHIAALVSFADISQRR